MDLSGDAGHILVDLESAGHAILELAGADHAIVELLRRKETGIVLQPTRLLRLEPLPQCLLQYQSLSQ